MVSAFVVGLWNTCSSVALIMVNKCLFSTAGVGCGMGFHFSTFLTFVHLVATASAMIVLVRARARRHLLPAADGAVRGGPGGRAEVPRVDGLGVGAQGLSRHAAGEAGEAGRDGESVRRVRRVPAPVRVPAPLPTLHLALPPPPPMLMGRRTQASFPRAAPTSFA